MDQRKRLSQIEEILAEVLRRQDQQTEILQQHTQILQQHSHKFDHLIITFNTGFEAMLKKMDDFTAEVKGLRGDFAKSADHEDRLKKLEAKVFKKGA